MLSQCRTWTRRRYRITNNRYQSANVTLGVSCQRHAERNVTGARIAATRRHEVKHGHGSLSDYERALRERGDRSVVPARRRWEPHGHSGASARRVTSRRHEVRRRTADAGRYQNTNNRYQSANVTLGLLRQRDADRNATDTAARVRRGVASHRHEVMRGQTKKPLYRK